MKSEKEWPDLNRGSALRHDDDSAMRITGRSAFRSDPARTLIVRCIIVAVCFCAKGLEKENKMKGLNRLWTAVCLISYLAFSGQNRAEFDLQGTLELVNRPPAATPVEALSFSLHSLGDSMDVSVRPDRDGRFVLKNLRPGRYSLVFPMPGRIQVFTQGSKTLVPENFELHSANIGSLRLVIGMKTGAVVVKVRDFSKQRGNAVALLAPADSQLTLRESCYLNRLSGPTTTFSFVPAGKYRIFVVDAHLQGEVARYAPRFEEFLKLKATSIEISGDGQTEATAIYLENETVSEAIRQIGPLDALGHRK